MPATVMVVEDDSIIGAHLAESLERLEYRVAGPFDTGEAALAAAGAARPDLVLMDIGLAGELDGIATADQLRARYDLPVVFLTAHADQKTLARAKATEPFGYLIKPFQAASLQATIEVALYKHALTQQLKESEARYHLVEDHAADWVYWLDEADRCRYCSPSSAWVTGRPPESFLANPALVVEIVHPEDRAAFETHQRTANAARTEGRVEFRILLPDGVVRWHEHVCRPVYSADGRYRGRRASNRDITTRKRAEALLESEKRRYQLLLQTSTDAIHILDQSGSLREWNAAFLAHLGYSPEEAAGLNVAAWDLRWNEAQLRAQIAQLIQKPARFETTHRRKDGAVRLVEISAIGVTLNGEELLYASARDITERKRLEIELQTERDFALSVMNTMGQGLTVTDAALRFEYINPAYARFMGYRPEELLGKSPIDVTVDVDRDGLARAWADRLTGQTTRYESRLRRADGGVAEVLITGTPRWRQGQVSGTIAVITDLTERKQAERAMAEERVRLRALIAASRDGIALIGKDRQVYVVNEPVLRYLNLPGQPDEWEGRALDQALKILAHQAAPAAIFADARRVEQRAEQPAEGEWALGSRALHWMSQPVYAGARWLGWLVVLRDVTAERQVERLREDLTRTMVHDLRNPLSSVHSALECFALDGAERLSAGQQEMLALAHQSIESMLDLVTAILDVSRLESGQMPLNREPISLRELVAPLLHQEAALAAARHLTLSADLAPDLPATYADASLLRRVLQNLIGNALKFTPAGGRVCLAATVPPGESQIRISVSDTGPGIAPEVRDRLFQKFVTGHVPGHGSGLGLAFCRQAIEAHGGRIWVESRPALGGATFTFTTPIWELNG